MRQALADLELVAHGKTSRLDPDPVHMSKDPSRQPYGDASPPHEFYRARWEGCRTDAQRAEVLSDALDELLTFKLSPRPSAEGLLETRIKIVRAIRAGEPRREVCRRLGVSPQYVLKVMRPK